MSNLKPAPGTSFRSGHICWHVNVLECVCTNALQYRLRGVIIARLYRLRVHLFLVCVCEPALTEKNQFILPTVPLASGRTKIVPCLLPRLQHWRHDVAIHSQYCISLAFCEKVAANLSPQSTACQCEEGGSRGMAWRKLGQRPVRPLPRPSPQAGSVPLACR